MTITLGVVSALVIFTTVVPALKISVDGLLERIGFDRRQRPLGRGRYLGPLLSRSATLARRGAPVVILVAVIVGVAGGAAWTALDKESFQQTGGEVAEWKQNLPGPLGWDVHEFRENNARVEAVYQPASEDDAIRELILVEGDVTADDALEDVHSGSDQISDAGVLLDQPGSRSVRSPVTVMRAVAERHEPFAEALRAADSDANGVPDSDLESLYDRLYEIDEDTAGQVVERTDGEYRSLLVVLAVDLDVSEGDETVAALEDGAATMAGDDREATLAGALAVNVAILDELAAGILLTMAIALLAVFLAMAIVFRLTHGSASLGMVIAGPIALVIGLVIGGMYLLDVPLTLLTALLMSLAIGLGIDYNIHIGDRFADELRAGHSPADALDAAVTGTGGALLGSTLTSAGAFATIVLVPQRALQSFGVIVVLALVTAFATSVLVLPSVLWLWAGYADPDSVSPPATAAADD